MKTVLKYVTVLFLAQACRAVQNILNFGAIPDSDTMAAEQTNAQAFMDALVAANYTTDREVLVPAGHNFNMFAVWGRYVNNITITIDGNITASKRYRHWPLKEEYDEKNITSQVVRDFIDIEYTTDVLVRGKGTVDGNGFMWWVREYLVQNH